jgi:hypothetical protein
VTRQALQACPWLEVRNIVEAVTINWRELSMTAAMYVVKTLRLYRLPRITGTAHPFSDYFKGFDKVEAVRRIFGEKTERVLRDLQVEFTWAGGYMGVNNTNGHLMVSSRYLNEGDRIDIYLDVIHELVHVKQFMDGKELFDSHYSYTERPTEIEAYRCAVEEARRLGLSDARICKYLKTEWMSDKELERLTSTVNVSCKQVKNIAP